MEAIWHITKSLPIQTIIEGSESSRSKMEKTPITWTVPLALWLKSISNNDELFDHSKYLTHRPWLSDMATSYFMCPEKSAIMEYHEYQPNDEPLHFPPDFKWMKILNRTVSHRRHPEVTSFKFPRGDGRGKNRSHTIMKKPRERTKF